MLRLDLVKIVLASFVYFFRSQKFKVIFLMLKKQSLGTAVGLHVVDSVVLDDLPPISHRDVEVLADLIEVNRVLEWSRVQSFVWVKAAASL